MKNFQPYPPGPQGRNNRIVRIVPANIKEFSNNCETSFCDESSGRKVPKMPKNKNQYKNLANNDIYILEISLFLKASMMRKNLFVSIVALK